MMVRRLALFVLFLPLLSQADIKFHIKHQINSSHEGHIVLSPFQIKREYPYREGCVLSTWDETNPLHSGLRSGEQLTKTCVYAGNFSFLAACSVDGKTFTQPLAPTLRYIPEDSIVNVTINCQVNPNGWSQVPEISINVID